MALSQVTSFTLQIVIIMVNFSAWSFVVDGHISSRNVQINMDSITVTENDILYCICKHMPILYKIFSLCIHLQIYSNHYFFAWFSCFKQLPTKGLKVISLSLPVWIVSLQLLFYYLNIVSGKFRADRRNKRGNLPLNTILSSHMEGS